MESAKIPILHHQHHHRHRHRRHEQAVLPLQDQFLGSSTNSSTLEQYYAAPAYAAAHPSWTQNPNTILNPARLEYEDHVLNHQDNQLSFNWPLNAAGNNVNSFDHHHHQMQMSRSVVSNSCPNLSEMISSSPSSSSIEDQAQQQVLDDQRNDNVKLFLSTLSSGSGQHHQNNNNNPRFQSEDQFIYSSGSSSSSSLVASTPAKRATFSQIYPTINLSNINHHQDFLSSANLGGDFHQNSSFQGQLGYDGNYMKQSIPRPMELPAAANMSEEKGCNKANSEPKAVGKRSRVESTRPSCQPFKVRKEKLGDRIAALQQMVAPFGKTDTASVLMEAIGYIKFLQNQVETLSVPYLKSTRNKHSRATHGGENDEERKRDLRSRGLCLVPMSCLSYMTDTGGAVWPPPPSSYGGAT